MVLSKSDDQDYTPISETAGKKLGSNTCVVHMWEQRNVKKGGFEANVKKGGFEANPES